jgi:hypothetical protein
MATFGAFRFVPLEMMIRSISCDVIASAKIAKNGDHVKRLIKTENELMETMTKRGSIRVKASLDSRFSSMRASTSFIYDVHALHQCRPRNSKHLPELLHIDNLPHIRPHRM